MCTGTEQLSARGPPSTHLLHQLISISSTEGCYGVFVHHDLLRHAGHTAVLLGGVQSCKMA